MAEVHELSEVLIRKVFLSNTTWRDDVEMDAVNPPESLVTELSEAVRAYTDTLNHEATRHIVMMTADLEGYKEQGRSTWELLYKLNSVRSQLLTHGGDPANIAAAVAIKKILETMGIKIESGEVHAKS